MGRQGKFKPLMIPREVRASIKDEFFARIGPSLAQWREGRLPGHLMVGEYWEQLMRLWRPRDWKSGAYYRSCPARAHKGYEIWCAQPHIIVLYESLPSAQELLDLQCEGQRVVSLVTDPQQFTEEIHGRDPLSFLLHDLIHAYEFFADPQLMQAQIQFYRGLRHELQTNFDLQNRLVSDPIFAEKFEYLIADMNSHPAHLEAYYRHITSEKNEVFAPTLL